LVPQLFKTKKNQNFLISQEEFQNFIAPIYLKPNKTVIIASMFDNFFSQLWTHKKNNFNVSPFPKKLNLKTMRDEENKSELHHMLRGFFHLSLLHLHWWSYITTWNRGIGLNPIIHIHLSHNKATLNDIGILFTLKKFLLALLLRN
jgi:hypothetical protein